ncbi:uncharacterized protein LOC121408959 [Lytechinus variegatus]|uniref:uncharacterized protein LOC121408959 n=1 Tax=Lytechinus variegatus TaxID=7654 RepID=UPI001BB1C500|nr:uncharacterized protein LOC121408959 [Lytechinus variegatus]
MNRDLLNVDTSPPATQSQRSAVSPPGQTPAKPGAGTRSTSQQPASHDKGDIKSPSGSSGIGTDMALLKAKPNKIVKKHKDKGDIKSLPGSSGLGTDMAPSSKAKPKKNKPSPSTSNSEFEERLTKLESLLTKALENQATRYQDSAPSEAESFYDDSNYGYDDQNSQFHAGQVHVTNVSDDYSQAPDFESGEGECDVGQGPSIPALAAKFAQPQEMGQAIDDNLAMSASYLLSNKLGEKALEESLDKYPPPTNCPLVDVPRVNGPIWDKLKQVTRQRDLQLQKIQRSLTRGLTAFLQSLDPGNISEAQQDCLALLSNANFELNCTRKRLIRPDMNMKFTPLCKSSQVGKFLFGDDLAKQVKDLSEQQKAAAGMMRGQLKDKQFKTHSYHPYARNKTSTRELGWAQSAQHDLWSGNPEGPFLGQPQWERRKNKGQDQWQNPGSQSRMPSHSPFPPKQGAPWKKTK